MKLYAAEQSEEVGGWERWHDWQAKQQQPVIDWYLRVTGATDGQRVLDVACGSGIPALALAERVGANGHVVAVDISLKMLAATRRKAAAIGLTNVETREAQGDAIGGPDAAFDVVTCKDGLMFCPDIGAALKELRRVTKLRSRYAFSVWATPDQNPLFSRMFPVLGPFLPPGPPPAPDAPGPFRLAAPGELERVLRAAGYTDVTIEQIPFTWHFDSPAQHFESMSELAGPLERIVATLADDDRARLQRDLAEAFVPFTSPSGMDVPALQICASGNR
jgi:SAM-dependent methyltransferase